MDATTTAGTLPAHGTVDPRGFKQGMRAMAGAVAILAAEDTEHGCFGLTATAVCSFSAEPPSLLACVHRNSTFASLTSQDMAFSVNLPAADQENVARVFGGMTTAKADCQRPDATTGTMAVRRKAGGRDRLFGLFARLDQWHQNAVASGVQRRTDRRR